MLGCFMIRGWMKLGLAVSGQWSAVSHGENDELEVPVDLELL